MADAAMSGAAPTPTMEDFAAFEQIRQEVSPSELNETLLATAAEADPIAVAEFKSELRDLDLPPEVLDALDGMVDEILASPERYAEIRAHYLTQDMSEELLPETFDAEFFGALNIALDEIRATSGAQARAPQGFAMGGIASLGRNGDTMLAHVTPAEMKMLKDKGGAGTINPRTGLPEFFSLKKVFSKIGRAVKKFARSTVGKIVIGTALFFLAGPAATQMFGSFGTAAVAAGQGFIAGAGSSLLAGENLKDSLKTGAISAVTAGAVKGVSNAASSGSEVATQRLDISDFVPENTAASVDLGTAAAKTVDTAAIDQASQLARLTDPGAVIAPSPNVANVQSNIGVTPKGFSLTPTTVDTSALQQAAAPGFKMTAEGVTYTPRVVDTTAITEGVASLPPTSEQKLGSIFGLDSLRLPPATGSAGSQAASTVTEAPGFFESVKETFAPDRTLAERGTSLKEAFLPGKGPSLQEVLRDSGIDPMNATRAQLEAAEAVVADAATGLGRRYLPLAGAGLGVMALSGGFDTPQPELPAGYEDFMAGGGQRLLRENPEKYGLRFGGIQPLSSLYTNYAPPAPTYNAAMGSGPQGVDPNDFPRMNGPINGPGTGTSDDVPAMLSDGEFVFTAKAVRNMGDGSRRKGAKRMYAMMKKLENRANG